MDLKTYIYKNQINITELAFKCDTSTASLYFYMKGRKPNQKTAEKIEKFSDGLVTVKELRGKDDRIS